MFNKLFLIFLSLAILSGCAISRKEFDVANDRISKLESYLNESQAENSELKSKLNEYDKNRVQEEQNLRAKYAQQIVFIDRLREENQTILGKLESLENRMNKREDYYKRVDNSIARLDGTITSNTDRIIKLEQYMGFEPSKKFDLKVKSSEQKGKKLSEDQLYSLAKDTLDKGDISAAREGFRKFLKQFPKSDRADNAQFWIGDTYYKEKWFEKAILEYQKVVEKYPKGNKTPASLLKQGYAFEKIGEKANARLILKELIKKYSKSNEAVIAKKKLETLK